MAVKNSCGGEVKQRSLVEIAHIYIDVCVEKWRGRYKRKKKSKDVYCFVHLHFHELYHAYVLYLVWLVLFYSSSIFALVVFIKAFCPIFR